MLPDKVFSKLTLVPRVPNKGPKTSTDETYTQEKLSHGTERHGKAQEECREAFEIMPEEAFDYSALKINLSKDK